MNLYSCVTDSVVLSFDSVGHTIGSGTTLPSSLSPTSWQGFYLIGHGSHVGRQDTKSDFCGNQPSSQRVNRSFPKCSGSIKSLSATRELTCRTLPLPREEMTWTRVDDAVCASLLMWKALRWCHPPAEEKLFHATRIVSQLNKQLSYLGRDIRNASRKEKAKES